MNIIKLAKEAGIMESQMWSIKGLERFAALVREDERKKQRSALQMALGALVRAEAMYGQPNADIQTALREALSEQAEQEPVDWSDRAIQIRALQAIGAEWYDGKIRNQWIADTCHELTKVIGGAAPVRTKDLTEAEIDEIWKKHSGGNLGFAYAVIAKFKEKNK